MPACRTVSVRRYPVADFVAAQFAVDLAPHPVVALAGDHVPAAAQLEEPMAVSVSLLLLAHLLHRALAVARLPGLDLCRALAARAKDLRAGRLVGLSRRDQLARLVCHLQMAKATSVLRLPRALPLLQFVAARRACLFHAQLVTATGLTKEPVSHLALHDPLCRRAQAPDRDLHPLDLFLQPAPGCPPHERQHELAAESSLDLRL